MENNERQSNALRILENSLIEKIGVIFILRKDR